MVIIKLHKICRNLQRERIMHLTNRQLSNIIFDKCVLVGKNSIIWSKTRSVSVKRFVYYNCHYDVQQIHIYTHIDVNIDTNIQSWFARIYLTSI